MTVISLDSSSTLPLGQPQMIFRSPGTDQMKGIVSQGAILGASESLAVDGNDPILRDIALS